MIKTVILAISLFVSGNALGQDKHSVKDFGAIPNDDINDLEAINEAIKYVKTRPGSILYFPPGVYDIAEPEAIKLMNEILTGEIEGNSQNVIFEPYYPYAVGLNLDGIQDLSIEAAGATLLVDGWMEPISIKNTQGITITGISIDYKRRPGLEGTIKEVSKDSYTVDLRNPGKVHPNMPLNRILYYNNHTGGLMNREDYFPDFEIIDSSTLEIIKSLDPEYVGLDIMIPQTFHFRPAIFIFESKDVHLKQVNIHSQPGMGIVGHRSEDILMEGLKIVPPAGHIMSTNTDATHFTSTKGYLKYINCQFQGHGDDAANIHNYYLHITKSTSKDDYILALKNADWHAGFLDYPDVGDQMELVKRSSLEVVQRIRVGKVENDISKLHSLVSFDQSLPENIEDYYVVNVTRLPEVVIKGSTVDSNRARGFLIKSRNVLLENNTIRNSSGTGIHIGAEGSWHEGPAAANVKLRYNRIINTGSGAGTIDKTSGIAVAVQAKNNKVPGIHKNILIEGNIIEGKHPGNGISVSGAEDVIIRYNEIKGPDKPINVIHSERVEVHSNYLNGVFEK